MKSKAKSKEVFNAAELRDVEYMVFQALNEFTTKFYEEFGLLKCLLANPKIKLEIQRINGTGCLCPSANKKKKTDSAWNSGSRQVLAYKPNARSKVEYVKVKPGGSSISQRRNKSVLRLKTNLEASEEYNKATSPNKSKLSKVTVKSPKKKHVSSFTNLHKLDA